mgnify:CR=1 FL=1
MKIMLELMKSYTKPEMSAMFGTRSMQGLQRKIERYGVSFDVDGRGETANFTITNIENPFKIYCITELGFDGHTDFYKLRNYYYYYFNDIDGVKIDFEECWVHLRKSNTEPIIRVYTEAKSMDEADALAKRFISEIEQISKK